MVGLDRLLHRIDPLHDRLEGAGFDHRLELTQRRFRLAGKCEADRLVGEAGGEEGTQHQRQARIAGQVASTGAQGLDAGAVGAARHHVEDHVVAAAHGGEVMLAVVDEVLRAQAPEHRLFEGAVHGGDFRAH